jgi:glutamate 5-kinase
MKDLLVLKLGTSTITDSNGGLDNFALQQKVTQIAKLCDKYRVAVVSSGAVAAGYQDLDGFSGHSPDRKAAAAIGNPKIIGQYAKLFAKYNIKVAQILCERGTFADRKKFLELQETLLSLWKHNILPIVNENDVTSSFELRFSDNDELATLFAVGFGAKRLLLGTSVDGLLDDGRVIEKIDIFDKKIFDLVQLKKSEFGLGGMVSKLSCADKATHFGVEVVIFNACIDGNIIKANDKKVGTVCPANVSSLSSYHKWVAGIGLVLASVRVDEGAATAIGQRKSLLAVGLKEIIGKFEAGEVIELRTEKNDEMIGVARTRIASKDLDIDNLQHGVIVAHADEIVLW